MVPVTCVVLDALPVTASGKLDRRALPAPSEAVPAREVVAAPTSDIEASVIEIWTEILDVTPIARDDDFFALGGHSLLATQIISRTRATFDVAITLQHLFDHSTVEEFAAQVAQLLAAPPPPAVIAAPPTPAGDGILSYAQQRLWLVHELAPDSSAYHMPLGRRLRGELDLEALRRAFEDVIARHHILRTRFPAPGGMPRQEVVAPQRWELPVDDVSSAGDPEAELERISRLDLDRPFDLATGPLLRARVVRLGAQDHALLVTLHHIIGDGWSIDVLWRELTALYDAHHHGRIPTLAPLLLQYADHAAAQRAALTHEALAGHLAYWTRQLAGAPAELALPRRAVRTASATHEVVVELGAGDAAALRALAQREGATPFIALLAAFRATLARTTGQPDVVIGTPIANRERAELEPLIGLFLNTLALRTEVDPHATFADAIRRERETTLAAHAHQDAPFEMIVDELGLPRTPGKSPIFQIWFVQENTPQAPPRFDAALAEDDLRRGLTTTKFDLSVYVNEHSARPGGSAARSGKAGPFDEVAGGFELALVFDASMFEPAVIAGIAHRYVRALAAGAREPDRPFDELALAEPPVGSDLHAPLPHPSYPPVLAVIAELAAREPGAIAIRHADRAWTRGELAAAVDRVARALAEAGIAAGDRVALTGPPSAGLIAGFLGILRAGACFVPLSSRLSHEHADRVLAQVHARLVICVGTAVPSRVPVATLDSVGAALAMPAPLAPRAQAVDPELRYIYFTSGTTGAQKAVAGTLEPLAHFTAWQRATLGESAGAVCAQLTELGFDVFLRETMFALTAGKVLAVPPASVAELAPADVVRWLARERVTAIHTVPSLARAWLTAAPPDVELADLRCVFVVGEPLDATLIERWRARFGAATEFINFYGTTETGPAKAWHRAAHPAEPGIQPIGRALPDTQLVIVRDGLVPCAAGEVGELVIRTPFSSRGYLDAGGAGAGAFGPDDIYRTGDRARLRPDGAIEVLGRLDDQIKLHGQRVDPVGVAVALRAHRSVIDAAVIATKVADETRLVAYVVRAQPAPTTAELRELLRRTIPPYMIPAGFVFVDALPRKPNGKLDRDALPAPDWEAGAADAFTAPRNPEEEVIAGIWCEVLGLRRVGVRDDFFALGGHSLLAVLVASRVRATFGVELPIQTLFAAPTVEAFAAEVIRQRSGGGAAMPIAAITPIPRTGELPLSFAQQRMWFLHQLAPTSAAYHVPLVRHLRGRLAPEALRRAFEEVIRRHESLRAVFPARDGTPLQHIRAPERWELPVDDLAELDASDREAEVALLVREEAELPFELATGPLLRTRVVRLAPDDHLLLVTLHHIVSDGWSMGVFWDEVSALYAAYTTGSPPRLAALPVQYVDVAAWQRTRIAQDDGAALDGQLAYWKAKLAGAPELTMLPLKGPRPARASARGASVTLELDEQVVAAMRALGKKTGATQFMMLLAAFRAVLARVTGQDDVCIGTPIANRGRKEVEHVIGFMLNTLVLRTPLEPHLTFTDLVRRERTTALEAYAHAEAPFEMVVDALGIERSLDRTPLFQVSFVHQNMPQPSVPIGELVDEPVGRDEVTTRFDLSVVSFEHDGRLSFELIYNTDLFDRWQIEQLAAQFALLAGVAFREPDRVVSRLPVLAVAERVRLISAWNHTPGTVVPSTIPALFEAQADRTPDAVAVELGGAQLTYRELDARANQLAHALVAHGVGPEVVVGIALARSLDLVAAILAIGKAGGAWVPLDPTLPALRTEYIAGVTRPRVVITTTAFATPPGVPRLCVDDDAALVAQPTTRAARAGLLPDHLAYVLFTSGSTGQPKGVMITHAGIVNELGSAQALRARLDRSDAFLQLAPYTFDLSVHEILWPLSVGARVVLVEDGVQRDPRRIVEAIRAHNVTICHPIPTVLRALLAEPELARCTSLRTVCSGGEAMPLDVLRAFTTRYPRIALINSYGPTETSVTVSQWRAQPNATAVAVGTPWIATQLHVLDPELEPAPLGVVGELFIGGRQVGRGYAGQAALTAERFVPDPFATTPGARMYRTSDRAKRWRDGNVELLGRADSQIKLRGFRIELGEIVAVLREHGGAREVVVTVAGEGLDARLVAYVVVERGWSQDAARAALAARLPEYMVPKVFVPLDRLPLLPNAKVDVAALPAPDDRALAHATWEPPRTPIEELVAGIWIELLPVDRVGRHDNFFELGGHSLLATRLAWEVKVPVATIFTSPTLAELARAIEDNERGGEVMPPIVPVSRDGALVLSYAQQRMWFLQQLAPASAAYHIAIGRRLRGALDLEALRGAIEDLIARHEILRTSFPAPTGTATPHIRPPAPGSVTLHDLTADPAREASLARIARELTERPFDLATEPPIRIELVELARNDHALLVTLHHIAADGWSVGVLWAELDALYTARKRHRAARLPVLTVQYADYAAWQREVFAGDRLAEQLRYWTERLHGAPDETELPIKGPRPPVQTYRGAALRFRIERELADQLHDLTRQRGSTLFITLLAGLRALLRRYTGQDDLCIGAPNANRSAREIEPLIGLFLNTLVLRTAARGTMTFAELLAAERTTALEAYAHADAPFEMVVEAAGVTRSLARNPLFQVLFQLQFAGERDAPQLGGLEATALERELVATQVDLEVSALVDGAGIELAVTYNVDLFEAATIAALARHFRALLTAAVADPETSLARLALLTVDEQHELIEVPNRSARPRPEHMLPALVAARAARTPDAIAVEAGGVALSYAELVARTARLAHHLRALGLAPEDCVGVCVERDANLIVAQLAVLAAGGAYLPLDPDLPAERLSYMVADSRVRILITQTALHGRVPAEQVIDLDTVPLADAGPLLGFALPPERLAYVLYTSGSTGRPKAVHVQHGSLANFLATMLDAPGMTAHDTLLAVTTASFDISGLELYLPLVAGGRVVIASRDDAHDGARVRALLETTGATIMQATPAAWRNVLDAGWQGRPGFVALCGGEALPPDLATALVPVVGALWNLYGPTETTIWSARKQVVVGAPIRLGDPIANTQLYVLDPLSFEVQPPEVAGELFIAGDGLARGYGGQPGLTAERFLPDPFATSPGARMYRTGDRVRRRASVSAELEFLGRVDHQIKLRGFRIELGEIEAVLGEHPNVADVVVVVRDERLVAYVVELGTVVVDKLLGLARERLPAYMVPTAVVILDELPLSPAGKIDRRALPAPSFEPAHAHVAPRTEIEIALAAIWRELLGRAQVGIRDNFFELGGHSLMAIRLLWAINRAFGATIALRQVFAAPTIEQFAALPALVGGARRAPGAAVLAPTGSLRCAATVLQQANHDIHKDDPTNGFVHMALGLELAGPLDRAALVRALGALVRRHTILRTTYREIDGALVQIVLPADAAAVPIDTLELAHRAEAERAEVERVFLTEVRARRFDLATELPVRAGIVVRAPDRHALALIIHHTCGDGPSMRVVLDELLQLYLVETGVARLAPPAAPVEFSDFAEYLLAHARTPRGAADAAYWQRQLAGAPAVAIPSPVDRAAVDRARAGRPRGMATFGTHSASATIDAAGCEALRQLARDTDATLMVTLLAGLAATLHELTAQTDICIQSTLSQRDQPALERVIGPVANPLIMRLDLGGAPALRTVVERAQRVVLEAFDAGRAQIIADVSPGLRRVNFNFNRAGADTNEVVEVAPGLRMTDFPVPIDDMKTPFDIHLWLFERADGISLVMLGNRELFDQPACARFLARYVEVLGRASAAR